MAKTIIRELTGDFQYYHGFPWDQYVEGVVLSVIEGLVYLVSFSERSRAKH